jgi:hypothetical protein
MRKHRRAAATPQPRARLLAMATCLASYRGEAQAAENGDEAACSLCCEGYSPSMSHERAQDSCLTELER